MTPFMSDDGAQAPTLDPVRLLAALAGAEQHARDGAGLADRNRSLEYRAGAGDAYADAQELVRKMIGMPVEADSDR
ncbi:hypothetical protein Amsp01_041340 [Amycolatopsis sp. NBRC 101858]|uniref:hypothetical protein n=1 Tax=Amycolatopsis sp. NBRC 101858 TaxID=3032200 RepID=UPI0024A4A3DA|nr:hypothetical protein [Amycolatopsis sp. NBRC 101858]GLY38110.1 hypothetical protein Amsp01_041340 [Amycolatopsis sp. NBRC 101858]